MEREIPKHRNERKKKKKPSKSDHKHVFLIVHSEILLKLGGKDPLCVAKVIKTCKICDRQVEKQLILSESKYLLLTDKSSQ